MDSGSSYRVYPSSDLHSIPPTAITKKVHVADDGVGWSGFAFLVAVGVAIGGASLAAMHVVKPDASPRPVAAAVAPIPEPVPMPVAAQDPPTPVQTVSAPAPTVEPVKLDATKKPSKPRRTPKAKHEPVPANPYDATQIDRGLPPQI